ncbi:Nramp family divalent metal transporter [Zavarzinia sp.]|uniref:Nramp family divalent metal transporter n=1 Tax=Zavarzinia sp. TaxID=2027920 RepID=UPI0035638E26
MLLDRLARTLHLPRVATAPFCPGEVRGTVVIPPNASLGRRLATFAGPGLLVAVGYMDPGNWATDLEAGSAYGYDLLFVVALSSLAAMLLQTLAMRLGIVAGVDLAQACRARYGKTARIFLWLMAEAAIVATDVAEVLGAALAINLLFGLPLAWGVVLTALDMLLVLGLKGQGFREVEAIVLGLVATIGACFLIELVLARPDGAAAAAGLVPDVARLGQPGALYAAIGILGATVMPHNLYLHSSIVQTRRIGTGPAAIRSAVAFARLDTIGSLLLAALVNGAILMLAAATFHAAGNTAVADIADAHRLLEPLTGAAAAGVLFAVALFASGQSSTFTGTIAGQIVLEGFMKLRIPCWQRRVITRVAAIVPALIGILWLGEGAVGKLLVLTQVVLSLQLPFAIYPLIRVTGDRRLMGGFVTAKPVALVAWLLFGAISAANIWLVIDSFA